MLGTGYFLKSQKLIPSKKNQSVLITKLVPAKNKKSLIRENFMSHGQYGSKQKQEPIT